MHRVGLLAFSVLAFTAFAQSPSAQFERARRDATNVPGGLASFLEQYIGECAEAEGGNCRQQAQQFRQKVQGRKLYFSASEESAALLAPGPENRASATFVLDLTPLFPSGGYALTHGSPRRTDSQGNPVLPVLSLPVTLPEDRSWSDVKRMVATRGVRVELVAVPRGVWTLPKPRGGKWYGVSADFKAVLVTSARSGEQVALWVAPN
jgi:hypothetical protein